LKPNTCLAIFKVPDDGLGHVPHLEIPTLDVGFSR
jgi:hypothetical protein